MRSHTRVLVMRSIVAIIVVATVTILALALLPTRTNTADQPDASASPSASPTPQRTYSQPRPPQPGQPVVHLTFDDGPDPVWTPQILDLLEEYGAQATFFVQGQQLEAYPDIGRDIVSAGHTIQNHSWSHPNFTEISADQVRQEVDSTTAEIVEVTGQQPECVRVPFGATNANVNRVLTSEGYTIARWDLDPQDYNEPGASAISATTLANVQPGSVILLHDAGGTTRQGTIDALRRILPALVDRGYAMTAMCDNTAA